MFGGSRLVDSYYSPAKMRLRALTLYMSVTGDRTSIRSVLPRFTYYMNPVIRELPTVYLIIKLIKIK